VWAGVLSGAQGGTPVRQRAWLVGLFTVMHLAVALGVAQAQTFRIAEWNVRSGFGRDAILNGNNNVFVEGNNCTTNAWGVNAVQQQLIDHVKNDPLVVALVVNEAWTCATPQAIVNVLGAPWTTTVDREGVAVLSRFGFAATPVSTQIGFTAQGDPFNRYIWRAPVWVDAAHSASFVVYGTHLDKLSINGQRMLDVTATDRTNNVTHAIFGDLNTRPAVSNCGSVDSLALVTTAGYSESWPAVNTDPGYTGTVNHWDPGTSKWCGVPTGHAYKRIDLGLDWGSVQPTLAFLFANPPQIPETSDSPSDHYGVVFEYSLGGGGSNLPPTADITAPANNAVVSGPTVSISVTASDDHGVTSVDLKRDGTTIQTWTAPPFTMNWDSTSVGNGLHTLQAVAHDAAGLTGQDSITVDVENPPPPGGFWTATVNATVTGTTLQKTGGCGSCLDAGGISATTIASGDGYIQFTPSWGTRLYAGFSADRTNSTAVDQIQYAFSFWTDGTWDIREFNVYKTGGTHTAGDVFKISVEAGVVKYYRNAALVYTSTAAPVYPLGLDVTFLTINGTVSSPTIFSSGGGGGPITSDIIWTNAVNSTVTANTLQKTSGCTTCPDAGGISQQTIDSGNGNIEYTPSVGHRFYAGLGRDRSASTDRSLIDYAFSFWTDSTWDIRESDVYRTGGAYVSGDAFKIAIESGVVKYYKNGALVYTSGIAPAYPIGLDTTLFTVGSTVSTAKITK
jgi:hypothetical protein